MLADNSLSTGKALQCLDIRYYLNILLRFCAYLSEVFQLLCRPLLKVSVGDRWVQLLEVGKLLTICFDD